MAARTLSEWVGLADRVTFQQGDATDLPFEDDELEQGGVCARVTGKGLCLHTLWSPVTGRVMEVNEELNRDCSLANRDPYGAGWLARVQPIDFEADVQNMLRGLRRPRG